MTEFLLILAQATSQPKTAPAPPGMGSMLMPLLLMGLIFYFIMIRPQGAEKKRREQMLNAIKKNDRVVTVGGIMGVVQSVKDDEITLKVDESSNTKITFTRSAISRVVSAGPAEQPPSQVTTVKK
ncbi:MAG TPA: preprotein translocase subunit YajC [Phycisphaerae bacterium]|nr:preprotein translocase subunit YajC [Phycisphaerae bacterium]